MRALTLLAALAWCAASAGAVVLLAAWLDADVRGVLPLSVTRLLLVSAMSIAVARRLSRPPQRLRSADLVRAPAVHNAVLAILLCAFTAVLIRGGADGVGGADSAGYLAQAHRWRSGALSQPLPFPDLPVHDPAWAQAPLGFRPAPAADATVPIYPPGWPLLLAAALSAGDAAATRVLPGAFAVLAILGIYFVGRALHRPPAALLGAVLFASSPPFLFQALQPMSDVPALAGWLVAMAAALRCGPSDDSSAVTAAPRAPAAPVAPGVSIPSADRPLRYAWLAGVAAAVAVGIRPNLAPLLPVTAWIAARGSSSLADRARLALPAAVPGLLVVAAVAALQARLYGTVGESGYGAAHDLFSLTYIVPNLARQAAWTVESHGWPAVVLLLIAVPALTSGRVVPRSVAAMGVVTWLLYLVYVPSTTGRTCASCSSH